MHRRNFLGQLVAAVPAWLTPSKLRAFAPGLDMNQLTCSTASLSGMSFEESLRKMQELGFAGVEILTFSGAKHSVGPIPGVVLAELSRVEKRRLRSLVDRFRYVTTHLPFHGLQPVASDLAVRKATLDRLHQAIDDSAFWGASIAVVHVAPQPGKTYEQIWPDLLAVFRELGDHAARYNLRLGIETGAPNTVKEYLGLIRDLKHDFVGGCVDTGHTRAYRADIGVQDSERATPYGTKRYNDVLMQKVEGLGPKLIHFHVDDVRPADWREHRTLGAGLVDWQRLLGYLSRISYEGTFAIELEETPPVDALQQSRRFFQSCLANLAGSGDRS